VKSHLVKPVNRIPVSLPLLLNPCPSQPPFPILRLKLRLLSRDPFSLAVCFKDVSDGIYTKSFARFGRGSQKLERIARMSFRVSYEGSIVPISCFFGPARTGLAMEIENRL
jgi:hypothetical protein